MIKGFTERMNEKTAISIVTYNSRHIFRVLDNLKKELADSSEYEIHIFDNHSNDDYIAKLETYVPFIFLHKHSENQGFGYGHNVIFRQLTTKYGIVFNPDVLVTKEALDAMVNRIRENDELAMVCPKVLNEDGTTQYLVRQKLDVFDYMLRFIPFNFVKKLFDKRLAYYECRDLSDDQTAYIRMGSGCFMLLDIKKFNDIGGFDERFFMYFEDNDLCLRFEQAGQKILYTPFEPVIHIYEKAAHKSFPLFNIFMKSMYKFFNKWGWRFF